MLDKYILLNQKPKTLIRFYFSFLLLLSFIIIVFLLKIDFTPYFIRKSKTKFLENNYYLKLNMNIKELNLVSSKNKIVIDSNDYFYKIYKIDVIDGDKASVYLEVLNLSNKYKINNYSLLIKLEKDKKGLINY